MIQYAYPQTEKEYIDLLLSIGEAIIYCEKLERINNVRY